MSDSRDIKTKIIIGGIVRSSIGKDKEYCFKVYGTTEQLQLIKQMMIDYLTEEKFTVETEHAYFDKQEETP